VGPPQHLALNSRFEAQLQRARQIAAFKFANYPGAPFDLAELDARVRPVYFAAYAARGTIRFDVETLRAEQERLRNEIKDDHWLLRHELKNAPANLRGMQEALRRTSGLAARQNLNETITFANFKAQQRAEETRRQVIDMVAAHLPSAEYEQFRKAMRDAGLSAHKLESPMMNSATAPRTAAAPTSSLPATSLQAKSIDVKPANIPPVAGKIAEIDALLNDIAKAKSDLAALRAENTSLAPQAAASRTEKRRLERLLAPIKSKIDDLTPAYRSLQQREGELAYNGAVASGNLYKMALAELTWTYVRDRVVLPRVKSALNVSEVDWETLNYANELRRNPLKLAPLFRRTETMERLAEVQRDVAQIAPNFTRYAEQAVAAAADPSWVEAEQVRDRIHADIGAKGMELVEKALGQSDSIPANYRKALFPDS
jgi:hypothetical protein